MKVMRAFRYRLEPTEAQDRLFVDTAGICRFVYNCALEWAQSTYRMWVARGRPAGSRPGSPTSWKALSMELPEAKRMAGLEFLKVAPHHCLNQALIDLSRAFGNFFAGRAAYPNVRRRFENDSFRYPDPTQIKVSAGRAKQVFLPKAGWVRLSLSRRTAKNYGVSYDRPWHGELRSVTVRREGNEWWASLCCEVELPDPQVDPVFPKPAVGIDRGIATSLMPSWGDPIRLPVPTKRERGKLARMDRQISRSKKGSQNRNRQKEAKRRYVRHLVRRRLDAIRKAAADLAKSHSVIVVEALNIRGMSKSARGTVETPGRNVKAKSGLNREILAQCWGLFVRILEQKCEEHGAVVVKVPSRYTSQTCAGCGAHDPACRVSRDRWECAHCGYADDADRNAARVIEAIGLGQVQAWLRAEAEPVAQGSWDTQNACQVA